MMPGLDVNMILLETTQFLVVDKPAGLSVLTGGWGEAEPSLVQRLEERFGRTWVVHRLDKTTSGVMVFARTPEAHRDLSLQFEHHQVQKVYHAIVQGEPAWETHTSRQPLRVDAGHSHRTVIDHRLGKPSETNFRVQERLGGFCLLEAMPASGRTHQVRVHATALGFPILGDHLYGAAQTNLITHPALHAWSLTFRRPDDGEPGTFTAPHPQDFREALERLRNPARPPGSR
jgi:RluA family pseudouridine synthase